MTFLRSWLLSVTACAVLVSIVQQLTDFFQKAYDLGYIAAYRFEEASPALRTIADFSLAPGKVYYPKGLREGGEAAE